MNVMERENDDIFFDEDKARAWLEKHIWGEKGPTCSKCQANTATLMRGKSHRAGLYKCNSCYTNFTVTVGTIYHRSHTPLHKWLHATYLIMNRKSIRQMSKELGFPYHTAHAIAQKIHATLAA